MITVGAKLESLSQINRALKSGFAVEANLIFTDVAEHDQRWWVQRDVIRKMTDLHESAYNQLVGIVDYYCGPSDHLDMYNSYWVFVVFEN